MSSSTNAHKAAFFRHTLCLLLALFALGVFGGTIEAAAAPYVLTLQLDVPADREPDHFCVISAGAHPDAQRVQTNEAVGPVDGSTYGDALLDRLVGVHKDIVLGPPHASLQLSVLEALREKAPGQPGPGPNASSESSKLLAWRFRSATVAKASQVGPLYDRPWVADAIIALAKDDIESTDCRSGSLGTLCHPVFEVPVQIRNRPGDIDKLHMACRPNVRPTGHESERPQVAVVFLNTHTGLQPPIRKITLDGNTASVEFGGNVDDQAVFVASVLGGHYVPAGTSTSANRRVVLSLIPRCHERDLELPYHNTYPGQQLSVKLRESGEMLATCESKVIDGMARMRLPYRVTVELRSLELRDASSGLHFVATWSERVPPGTLRVSLRGVSFHWRRDCLYPKGAACPSARLADLGLQCDAAMSSNDTACSYICNSGNSTAPMRLPETVLFIQPETEQSWTLRLTSSGQKLEGYVQPADRKIRIDLPKSDSEDWAHHVKLSFPNGQTDTIPFKAGSSKYTATPGVQCDQVASYRYVGLMPYVTSLHSLAGGVLVLEEPKKLYVPFDMRVFVGLGHEFKAVHWASKDEHAQGFGEGAMGTLGVTGLGSPWASPFFVEVEYWMNFGRREYYVQDPSGAQAERGAASFRFLIGARAGVHFSHSSFGLGLSGGSASPLAQTDTNALPARNLMAPMVQHRLSLGERWGLSVIARAYLFERTRTLDSQNYPLESIARNRISLEFALDYSLLKLVKALFEDDALGRPSMR